MKTKLVTAAIAALALVGACSASPGTAATVDGRRISENSIDELAADLEELGGQVPQRKNLVNLRVQFVALAPVVEKMEGRITPADRGKIAQSCAMSLLRLPELPKRIPADIETICVADYLASNDPTVANQFLRVSQSTKVTLSERYGVANSPLPKYLVLPNVSR